MALPSTVDQLLSRTNSQKIYLVEVRPYNIITGLVQPFYLSTDQFATEPTDTPSSAVFIPVLQEIPTFNRSISDVLAGETKIDLGSILIPDSGRFNAWMDRTKYIWGGYEFSVKVGASYFPYSAFEEVISGVMLDIEYGIEENQRLIRIRVGSTDVFLEQKTLHQNTYTSAPNATLDNKVIPIAYGLNENIRPDLYDEVNLIYQFNDGNIGVSEDVVMVYDQNVDLTLSGTAVTGTSTTITLDSSASITDDEYNGCEVRIVSGTGAGQVRVISDYVGSTKVATVSTAWSVNPDSSSQYLVNLFIKDLANGRFTLIDAPTSVSNITADVKGLNDSLGSYLETTSDIVKHMLLTSGGLTTDDIDSATFSSFPNSDPVQKYFNTEIKVTDAISWFLSTAGASGGRNRLGKYQLIRLDAPPSSGEDIELTEIQIFSIKRESYKPPVSSIILGYRQNYTPQGSVAPDNAATDERKQFVSEEYRRVESTASGAADAYKLAEEAVMMPTGFSSESGALAEANRLANIFKYPSDIYTIECTANPFKQALNDVVKITYPAYDLENGAYMRIIGIDPNISEGTKIRLTLWRLHN